MRLYSLILLALSIAAAFNALLAQKTPPEQIVFTAKTGNVTFNHAAHTKRANNDCQTCHDKLFPNPGRRSISKQACTRQPKPPKRPAEAVIRRVARPLNPREIAASAT